MRKAKFMNHKVWDPRGDKAPQLTAATAHCTGYDGESGAAFGTDELEIELVGTSKDRTAAGTGAAKQFPGFLPSVIFASQIEHRRFNQTMEFVA